MKKINLYIYTHLLHANFENELKLFESCAKYRNVFGSILIFLVHIPIWNIVMEGENAWRAITHGR